MGKSYTFEMVQNVDLYSDNNYRLSFFKRREAEKGVIMCYERGNGGRKRLRQDFLAGNGKQKNVRNVFERLKWKSLQKGWENY